MTGKEVLVDEQGDQLIAIIGAGTMGWQIALQMAAHGTRVHLCDRSESALESALTRIGEEGPRLAAANLLPSEAESAVDRIEAVTSLNDGIDGAWLVIEAIPERVDLKRALFAELSSLAAPETILATNSSSFKSRLLADAVSRPERLLNTHFYNVPWERSGVELMTCGQTDPAVIERVARALGEMGLVPVVARAESTGFVYNRIWHAIKRESLRVVAEGVASPEEVDRLWSLATGSPLGPFAQMDRVGLDVVLDIERHYAGESGDPRGEPPAFLEDMVRAGALGRKTGHGFYQYPDPPFEQPGWPRRTG